jgi:tetratricopeptide (TPR) repeat protein
VQQSERAQRAAAIAHEANRFLSTMLESASPAAAGGRDLTVRELVDVAAREIADGSQMDAELAGSILQTLGEAYDALGIPERAEDCLRRAVELNTQALGVDAPPTLECRAALSKTIADRGRGEEAAAMSAQALADARRALSADDPLFIDLLTSRNDTLGGKAALAERSEVMTECVERCTRRYGPDHRRTLQARAELAVIHLDLGRVEQGLAELADIRDCAERALGADHPASIASLENHAAALQRLNRTADAEPLIRRAVELSQRVYGPSHPSTLRALRDLTVIVTMQGRFAEAEPIAKRLLDGRVQQFGPAHPAAIEARSIYARTLIMQRKVDAARPIVEEVQRLASDAFGDTDARTLEAITLRYDLAEAAGDRAEMARWAEKLKGTPFDPDRPEQTDTPR